MSGIGLHPEEWNEGPRWGAGAWLSLPGRLLLIVVGLTALGCTKTPEESSLESGAPLVGGSVVADVAGSTPLTQVVGLLVFPDRICSGTLVREDVVLTAAHCVCTANDTVEPPGSVSFVFLNSPASFGPGGLPPSAITFQSNATAVHIHPKAEARCLDGYFNSTWEGWETETDAHDLAVVDLANPVPASVSGGIFPSIAFGGIRESWKCGTANPPTGMRLVGYGATGVDWEAEGAQPFTRRTGTNDEACMDNDPCGPTEQIQVDSVLELPADMCNPSWLWVAPDHEPSTASFRSGDSGGPLYVPDGEGNMLLAGVVSGHRAYVGSPTEEMFWAPTFDAGGTGNGSWLRPLLGVDEDRDGVLDRNDNCPPVLCERRDLAAEECANASQVDADADGVGDVCDNCPPSACAPPPTKSATFYCKNPMQEDADHDGKGDSCDLCVRSKRNPRGDSDDDGIGNACDPCPTKRNARTTCTRDRDCEAEGAGTKCAEGNREDQVNVKHPVTGDPIGRLVGFCSGSVDSDDDGLPDDCDNCPNEANPTQLNTNTLAEDRENRISASAVEKLGDACDSVPVLRMEQVPTRVTSLSTTPTFGPKGDGEGAEDVTLFDAASFVASPVLSSLLPDEATADLRFCRCTNRLGERVSLEQCVGTLTGSLCPWNDPTDTSVSARWAPVTTLGFDGDTPLGPRQIELPLDPGATDDDDVPLPLFYGWNYFRDVELGRIPQSPAGCAAGTILCQAYGAMFSRVVTETWQVASSRDDDHELRDNFVLFDVPSYIPVRITIPPIAGTPLPDGGFGWLRPDLRVNGRLPIPDPPGLRSPFPTRDPILEIPQGGGHIGILDGTTGAAIDDIVSVLVAEDLSAIANGGRRQLTPVESGALIRAATASVGGTPTWASVPGLIEPTSTPTVAVWTSAGTMAVRSEVLPEKCENVTVTARWEPGSVPGEVGFPVERTFRIPARVRVSSGVAAPGSSVELVLERDDFETCTYVESAGEYLLDVCVNGLVGSAFAGDDLTVDRLRLRILNGGSDPFEVSTVFEQRPPCTQDDLPPDPTITVSRATSLGGPSSRLGFAAAFSAIEDAIYIAGGKDPTGHATRSVLRWDIATNRSELVAPAAEHSPTDRVLGLAYYQPTGSLYVLDVERVVSRVVEDADGAHGSGHHGWGVGRGFHHRNGHGHRASRSQDVLRLYRYDPDSGDSTLIWSSPFHGKYDNVWLTALEDGQLALIAADHHAYRVWRLRDEGGTIAFTGSMHRIGRVLDRPVMGDRHPVLAVAKGRRFQYETLEPSQFRGHSPCAGL